MALSLSLQMEIFDAYVEDLIRQEKAKDKKGAKSSTTQEDDRKKGLQLDFQNDDVSRVSRAAKVMERMVNQNTFDDIAQGEVM
jgi:dynein intermediate chain 1